MARRGRMEDMPLMTPIKRLTRPKEPPPFRLTARDIALLIACAAFRFATSVQLARIVGGSSQQIVRRLQFLFAHGYLDRPPGQFVHLAAFVEGSQPLIYALTRKGALKVAELGHHAGIDPEHVSQNNRSATSPFIAHTLAITEFMLAAESSCTDAGLELIDQHRLIALTMPEATRKQRDPLRLPIRCLGPDRKPTTIAAVPDRLFSIVREKERTNYALEIDRGTERIRNKFSLKHYAYLEAWRQDAFKTQWAFQRLRVATVTTSEKRIDNMLAAQRATTNDAAPGLFIYTTFERVAAEGILAPIWKSAEQDNLSLLGSS